MDDLRQYLIRIAVINWLLSLFKANPELCTYEGLMDELAAWLLSDVCALEGCDNPLIGYPSTAFYCCEEHRSKAYNQIPEHKAMQRGYGLARRQTPEYKASEKARWQTPEYKANARARQQTPEYKAYKKAYRQTPEYKAAAKAYMKVYGKARYANNREAIKEKARVNYARKKAERLAAIEAE